MGWCGSIDEEAAIAADVSRRITFRARSINYSLPAGHRTCLLFSRHKSYGFLKRLPTKNRLLQLLNVTTKLSAVFWRITQKSFPLISGCLKGSLLVRRHSMFNLKKKPSIQADKPKSTYRLTYAHCYHSGIC